jgi:hypothetical protein
LLVVFRAGRIPGGSCPALLTTQLVLLCSPRDKHFIGEKMTEGRGGAEDV